MANMGRPTVITDEVIRKLEEAFVWGCTDLEACLWADISKTAFYNYQDSCPDFKERKELLKKSPLIRARKTVYRDMDEDSKLAMNYLEKKCKGEFSGQMEINMNADISTTHSISDTERELFKNLAIQLGNASKSGE